MLTPLNSHCSVETRDRGGKKSVSVLVEAAGQVLLSLPPKAATGWLTDPLRDARILVERWRTSRWGIQRGWASRECSDKANLLKGTDLSLIPSESLLERPAQPLAGLFSPSAWPYALLLGFLTYAIALRAWDLGSQPFWMDEAESGINAFTILQH